ncbi:MAG: LytR/AlgR family response regulator transcription factor [Lachnospira sp.]
MTVAVCDDESAFVRQTEQILHQYEKNNNIELDIDTFKDGRELISEIDAGKKYDIILLDICMPDVDGINVGARIRDELGDNTTQIVYISSNEQYAMELFKLRPMDFLIKPVDEKQLYKVMDVARNLIGDKSMYLSFKSGKDAKRVELNRIRCIYIEGRKTVISMNDGSLYEFYGKIDDVYEEVRGRNFARVHKSFIVNCNYVDRVLNSSVIMDDGKEIPVSRNWKEEVKKIWQQFF